MLWRMHLHRKFLTTTNNYNTFCLDILDYALRLCFQLLWKVLVIFLSAFLKVSKTCCSVTEKSFCVAVDCKVSYKLLFSLFCNSTCKARAIVSIRASPSHRPFSLDDVEYRMRLVLLLSLQNILLHICTSCLPPWRSSSRYCLVIVLVWALGYCLGL